VEVAGIETVPAKHALAAKLNIAATGAEGAAAALAELSALLERFDLGEPGQGRSGPTALLAFSARFFVGVLDPVANARQPRWRFPQPPPRCLRTMRARGDEAFAGVATLAALAAAESDLLLFAECDDEQLLARLAAAIERLAESAGLEIRELTRAFVAAGSRDPLGHRHGTSNLQDLRRSDPQRYRGHVYISDREPAYAGDTYLVLRKYRIDMARWNRLSERDRARTVGRSRSSDRIVDAAGTELEAEPDAGEGVQAPERSHIRQANPRGVGRTQFGSSVRTRDVRLLRRSFSYFSEDPSCCDGLLFLAFQADIQERGFEYVNNEWIMARGFLGGRDALLAPESRLVEVLDGCYYWLPVANSVADVIGWLRRSG
jgi:Dyp-type peroxidase family